MKESVDHAEAFGRIAFSCPSSEVESQYTLHSVLTCVLYVHIQILLCTVPYVHCIHYVCASFTQYVCIITYTVHSVLTCVLYVCCYVQYPYVYSIYILYMHYSHSMYTLFLGTYILMYNLCTIQYMHNVVCTV